jgi:hypothetical protein
MRNLRVINHVVAGAFLSAQIVIPSGARDLTVEASVTQNKMYDQSASERSLTFVRDDSAPVRSALQSVTQRIRARFQKFFRAFPADWFHEITQRSPGQPRFVSKFRHQIPAVPFHPADFVFL